MRHPQRLAGSHGRQNGNSSKNQRDFALCSTEGVPQCNFTFQRRNENLTIIIKEHFDHHILTFCGQMCFFFNLANKTVCSPPVLIFLHSFKDHKSVGKKPYFLK